MPTYDTTAEKTALRNEYYDPQGNLNVVQGAPKMPRDPRTLPGFSKLAVMDPAAARQYETEYQNAALERHRWETGREQDYKNQLGELDKKEAEQVRIGLVRQAQEYGATKEAVQEKFKHSEDVWKAQQQQAQAAEQERVKEYKDAVKPYSEAETKQEFTMGLPGPGAVSTGKSEYDYLSDALRLPKQDMQTDKTDPEQYVEGQMAKLYGATPQQTRLVAEAIHDTWQVSRPVGADARKVADLVTGYAFQPDKYLAAQAGVPIRDDYALRDRVVFSRSDGSQDALVVPRSVMNNLYRIRNQSTENLNVRIREEGKKTGRQPPSMVRGIPPTIGAGPMGPSPPPLPPPESPGAAVGRQGLKPTPTLPWWMQRMPESNMLGWPKTGIPPKAPVTPEQRKESLTPDVGPYQ